eukprot:SAG31_NODE_36105_length_316_cov_0.958525_1_plen_38_part_10
MHFLGNNDNILSAYWDSHGVGRSRRDTRRVETPWGMGL